MVIARKYSVGIAVLVAGTALACPYAIRDAGFIVRDPQPFRLVVFAANAEGANALGEQAADVADEVLRRANVQLQVVAPESEEGQADLAAREELAEREGAQRPDAMLVSPDGRRLSLSLADAGGDLAKLARSAVQSPVRDKLADGAIIRWCALVFIPGADQQENARGLEAANKAAQAMKGHKPEMGARISEAPVVTALRDAGTESVLRWSLGLDDFGTDRAKVAIIFGRGRRLGAVLWGATLTERNIRTGMELLGRNCTCTSEPDQILGPSMPLVWTEDRQALTREKLGFDPDAPVAMSALSGVWTNFQDGVQRTPGEYIPDPGAGYIELPFSDEPDPEAGGEAAAPGAPQTSAEAAGFERRGLKAVIIAVAVVAALVIGGSVALLIRQRGRM